MGWFRKAVDETKDELLASGDIVELARDTVADVLRSLGEHALPTRDFPPDEFRGQCETLARAVLLGGRKEAERDEAPSPRQVHADARRLVRVQRAAESRAYRAHRESAQLIVAGLVRNLRTAFAANEGRDAETLALLEAVEQAVETGDVEAIRASAARAADQIRHAIDARRKDAQEELRALADEVRSMRTELEETRARAETDGLTDLFNRGAFDEALDRTLPLSQATAQPLALYLVDIDHFKEVNDRYGHAAGDAAIRHVARTLAATFLRRDDVVARFGGDEFAALCPDVREIADAARLGERVRRAIAEATVDTDAGPLRLAVSIGFALSTPDDTPETLLRRADQGLYAAKRAGRDRVATAP